MEIIGIEKGDLNTIDNWVEEESFGRSLARRWPGVGYRLRCVSSPSQGAYSRVTVLLSEDGSLL